MVAKFWLPNLVLYQTVYNWSEIRNVFIFFLITIHSHVWVMCDIFAGMNKFDVSLDY